MNANLSKFEQYKHTLVNDANRSDYNDTLRPGRKKWHKIKLGRTINFKKLTRSTNMEKDKLRLQTTLQSIKCS